MDNIGPLHQISPPQRLQSDCLKNFTIFLLTARSGVKIKYMGPLLLVTSQKKGQGFEYHEAPNTRN